MTDLRTLTDAFTELEHRADGYPVPGSAPHAAGTVMLHPRAGQHRPRIGLVAASAAGVLVVGGVAAGIALRGSDDGASGSQAGGGPATSSAPTATSSAPSTDHFRIPRSAAELEADFRRVLDGRATFTVVDESTNSLSPASLQPPGVAAPSSTSSASPPSGAAPSAPVPAGPSSTSTTGAPDLGGYGLDTYIRGHITAGGAPGGYDLQILNATRGQRASCEDVDRSHCSVRIYSDGSSLALGHETIQGAHGSETFAADYVRADGAEILMHVSNQVDPKGDSAKLGANVPLSLTQLSSIVRSTRW